MESSFGRFLQRVIREQEKKLGVMMEFQWWNPQFEQVMEIGAWMQSTFPPEDGQKWMMSKRYDNGKRLAKIVEIQHILDELPASQREIEERSKVVLTAQERYIVKMCELEYTHTRHFKDPWTGNGWKFVKYNPTASMLRRRIQGMRRRTGFDEVQKVAEWLEQPRSLMELANSDYSWKFLRRPWRWMQIARFIEVEKQLIGKSDAEVEAMLLAVSL